MTTMRAEITGVTFRMSTTALMGKVKPGLLRRAEIEAREIKDEFQRLANGQLVNVVTGSYRNSIEILPGANDGDRVGLRVVVTDPKAHWIEYGTPPHIITARTPGGYLAFVGRMGDQVVVPWVQHPGTKARSVLRTAALNASGRSRLRTTK